MTIRIDKWIKLTLFTMVVCSGCSTEKNDELLKTSIVIGDVKVVKKGMIAPLVKDQFLNVGDTVIVGENAKVKIENARGSSWYLSKSSRLFIDKPIMVSGSKQRITATLTSGQLHIVKRSDDGDEFMITTSAWVIRITAADIMIAGSTDPAMCHVMLLNGFASFSQQGKNPTVIPVCSKLESGEAFKGELKPLTSEDVTQLKSWVGSTIIDEALDKSGCNLSEMPTQAQPAVATVNQPPEWKKTPSENIVAGIMVIDTIEASDPEQGTVVYTLESGPQGMVIDRGTGVITYNKIKDGTYPVIISAKDSIGAACTTSFQLQVSKSVALKLLAPSKIAPEQLFTVSAIVDKKAIKGSLKYRFDIDGDGTFEIPKKGMWGKLSLVKNAVLTNEGSFTIRSEAKDENGTIYKASRHITVNAPPLVTVKVVPALVKLNEPTTIDFSGSTDKRNGDVPLRFKVDINGDGTFDLPKTGELTEKTIGYSYAESGTYRIVVQATDKDGSSATASAEITVSKGGPVLEITGPDAGSINENLVFKCTVKDAEFPVTGYTWSSSDKNTGEKTPGKSEYSCTFTRAGEFVVACRVTDEKGQVTEVAKKVAIQNITSKIDAGGPYKSYVNSPMKFGGSASDADSKITLYAWDTDANGTNDVSSDKSPFVEYTYTKAGKYKAILYVETDDGNKSSDTADVEVINYPPRAFAGEDLVSKPKRKLDLKGSGSDTDGVIVKYEWDFNADGTYDWESQKTGITEHAFDTYSKAVLRVTDGDGTTATDTLTIIVCPEGMETIEKGKFCIDIYEFPNKRGSVPTTDISFVEAQAECAKQGKRLCSSSEWMQGCTNGRKNNVYPYGKQFETVKCNTLGNPQKKNSIAATGEFIDCKSDAGLFDMSGNVAEWTSDNGSGVAFGGSWQNGEQESQCNSKVTLSKDKKYFHTGFRCCK